MGWTWAVQIDKIHKKAMLVISELNRIVIISKVYVLSDTILTFLINKISRKQGFVSN